MTLVCILAGGCTSRWAESSRSGRQSVGSHAARAREYGLGLYATAPGTPPFADGLPGYLVTATGEFFDYDGEGRPPPDTPRRPAVAAGYIDTTGRFTHVFRYLDEETFRYNTRKTDDGARFQRAAGNIVGKRLTYGELIGKVSKKPLTAFSGQAG